MPRQRASVRTGTRRPGLIRLGLASVAALACLAAGCADAAQGHGVDRRPTAHAAVSGGAGWLAGRGGTRLNMVNADVARLSAALRASGRDAARAAAWRLRADTLAAMRGPMPVSGASMYRTGLRDLRAAGTAAVTGRVGEAASLIASGIARITKVTELADS